MPKSANTRYGPFIADLERMAILIFSLCLKKAMSEVTLVGHHFFLRFT